MSKFLLQFFELEKVPWNMLFIEVVSPKEFDAESVIVVNWPLESTTSRNNFCTEDFSQRSKTIYSFRLFSKIFVKNSKLFLHIIKNFWTLTGIPCLTNL